MILVTGGTGLVGAHLLYRLVSDNKKYLVGDEDDILAIIE